MKTTFLRLVMPILLLVCFTGCNEEEEKMLDGGTALTWEKCEGLQLGKNYTVADIPAEGISYSLVCTNAWEDTIWLQSVKIDGQSLTIEKDEDKQLPLSVEGEWGKVVCEGKNLHITIAPSNYITERVIEIKPTQIGCFYTFTFTQAPVKK